MTGGDVSGTGPLTDISADGCCMIEKDVSQRSLLCIVEPGQSPPMLRRYGGRPFHARTRGS